MSTGANTVSVAIDTECPMTAGGQIIDAAAIVMLKQVSADCLDTDEDRARLWCGALACLLAVMTAEIGADAAQAAYASLTGAFDEARKIRSGVH